MRADNRWVPSFPRYASNLCRIFLLASSISFVFLPKHVLGETVPPRVLTLQQALDIAVEKNRDILKAKEYRNYVMGKYKEERAA
ncbi:MAG TPA: TolC family protein, partial [Terriglobia bacterium]|nr:TolC family protein [Terriglobia bacterium]